MSVTDGENMNQPAADNRRNILMGTAIALGVAALLAVTMMKSPTQTARPKRAPIVAEIPVAEMATSGSTLPEIVFGKDEAPVTIVEYASMTCKHCATFHNTVFPKIKEKFIDTGKVRLVLREYPLDNLAFFASMMARCAGPEKSHAMISTLFKKQDSWIVQKGDPVASLTKIWEEHGLGKAEFDACRTNQAMAQDILKVRERADKRFGVTSTPAFFINGKRMLERPDLLESFEKAIAPHIKG